MSAGNSVPVVGYVRERVQIQSMAEDVKMLVIDLPDNRLHAVLGQSWLVQHRAVISYNERCVMYRRGVRRARLKCVPPGSRPASFLHPAVHPPLLNRMQVNALSKNKHNKLFMVNVNAVVDVPPKTQEMPAVVSELSDRFAAMPPGLPPDCGVGHTFNTEDATPVSRPMYRLSPKENQEVERQVKDLLARGLIQPCHLCEEKDRRTAHVCRLPCSQSEDGER